jgi:hypothetical protein
MVTENKAIEQTLKLKVSSVLYGDNYKRLGSYCQQYDSTLSDRHADMTLVKLQHWWRTVASAC